MPVDEMWADDKIGELLSVDVTNKGSGFRSNQLSFPRASPATDPRKPVSHRLARDGAWSRSIEWRY
jgi:hypothetical protein